VPTLSFHDHVYINCPFDGEYRPIFEALVFAVLDCGCVARCALELEDGTQVRIDKIERLIGACRLGIHDISRTELDERWSLPRFNMPLELGIFLGAKRFGTGEQRNKQGLILDRESERYQKFCSNIAGNDIRSHNGSARDAVKLVRNWLRSALDGSQRTIPSGVLMVERYERFQRELPLLCNALRLERDDLTFRDYTTVTVGWLRDNPW
jgi:hypothetical protein